MDFIAISSYIIIHSLLKINCFGSVCGITMRRVIDEKHEIIGFRK